MIAAARQPDLFPEDGLDGLSVVDELVAPDEEVALIAALDRTGLEPFRFHGWLGKRLSRSYGWNYDFDDGSFVPGAPIPDWLLPVRGRAARFAGLAPAELEQVLLLRYDPGAGIGWHRDRAVFEHVIGISLGNPTTMRFRRRVAGGFERFKLLLVPRAAYHLTGAARYEWQHSIPSVAAPRWSITFRSLSAAGRRRGAGK